jgi:hypothetical protein
MRSTFESTSEGTFVLLSYESTKVQRRATFESTKVLSYEIKYFRTFVRKYDYFRKYLEGIVEYFRTSKVKVRK